MMRSRVRVVIVCVILFALAAPAARRAASPAPAPGDPSRFIDSLFFAARYDTIVSLLPGLLEAARAANDSVLIGRLISQEGRVHLARGNAAEAQRLLDVALRIAESTRDTINWMPTLNYKGFVLVGQGRYEEALPLYEKRVALARLVHSPGDEAWGWSSIAYVHQMGNELARARDEYLRAVRLFREAGLPRQEMTPLFGLGQVLGRLGDGEGRSECYQRAWLIARDTDDPVNEMWATNNLGFLEFSAGDMGRALAYYRRAFEIGRETGFARGRIQPAINYALACAYVGRLAHAESVLVEARAVCESSGNTEFRDDVDLAIARVSNARGERRAAAALCRDLLVRRGVDGGHRDDAAITLANALANIDSLEAAAAVITGHFGAPAQFQENETTLEAELLLAEIRIRMGAPADGLRLAGSARRRAEGLGWRRETVRARFLESVCRRETGDGAGALEALHAALDSLDAIREGIGAPEWREAFGSRIAGNVIDAARVALEYPDSLPIEARRRAFFDVVQRVKARTLLERIAEPRFGSARVAERMQVARVTAADLQQRVLQDGELLLDFVAGEDESFLFAVTREDVELARLPGTMSALPERVLLFREIVSDASPRAREDHPPERVDAIARALGADILGPVRARVTAATRVLVSPDGFFAAVPFAALVMEPGAGEPPAPLIAAREVVTLPCAGVLAMARLHSDPSDASGVVAMTGETGDLPGARAEAGDLARRFRRVRVATGIEDAAAFAENAAGSAVLHIAAHARVNDDSPWESGFWLGQTAPAGGPAPGAVLTTEDSLEVARVFSTRPTLAAWQIAGISLGNDLAVLAGCETAAGRITRGEGVLGLTAAFLSAGVPAVVSAAWPIDDRVTAIFMRSFYDHLARAHPVSEALRRAQADLRSREEFSHPFYWAGFTVAGDGSRVVPVERARGTRWPLVLGGIGMAAGVAAVWYRGRRTRARLSAGPENRV